MGKAASWFGKMTMCFFRSKNDMQNNESTSSSSNNSEEKGVADQVPVNHLLPPGRSSYISQRQKLLKQHAEAVAAATAAAADAAAAVAEAALAVARASQSSSSQGMVIRKLAALKIQAVFRGYLARKALRALKSLVKVQALLRGYLVRKQMAAICRQALSRRDCCPHYMSATASSSAKLKQRPEARKRRRHLYSEKVASRYSFSDGFSTQAWRHDLMASRSSFSEISIQKRSLV